MSKATCQLQDLPSLSHSDTDSPYGQVSFLSFEILYLTSIKDQYLKMPYLSQMAIKWKKIAFFMLMDQSPEETAPAGIYTYHCRLCKVTSEVRYQIYFHLETSHQTEEVIGFLCDLPPRAVKEKFIKFLCGDSKTLASMKT